MKEHSPIKNQLKTYMLWPLVMVGFMILANISVALIDRRAGAAMGGFTFAGVILTIWLLSIRRNQILSGLVDFAAESSDVQKELLEEMSVPYLITDAAGRILWTNRAFDEMVREDHSRSNISAYFPELTAEYLEETVGDVVAHSEWDGHYYEIDMRPLRMDGALTLDLNIDSRAAGDKMFAMFLFDETRALVYEQEITNQKMVAGLIYLDNYDEALESVEAVRRSLLEALIDRKINKFITGMNGIVSKLEKDKYFFVIEQRYIEELQKSRFALLEDVKTVNIGNDMAVTLSIGIGMNGESYLRNYEYARASMDMALGRGGDQAVVKDGDKIRYYGGKSQQVEKTTRVKARVKAHALRELMDTKDKILIMGHRNGDIDCIGSAIGIWRAATSFDKRARIVLQSVNASVKPILEKFKTSPDYPEDMFLTADQALDWADANTMLVVVDVNRPSITEAPKLLDRIHTIVVLDHHRQSAEIVKNATLSYVEPYASSACEMVAEILQYIGDGIRIKALEADAMYAGIMIDTHNFMNQTGVRTFEAAAFLRRNGADVVRVRKLFRDKPEDYRARAEAIQNMEIYHNYYALSVCPGEGLASASVVGAQAANEMLDIVGIKASFVATKVGDTMYFSARSIDEVNVQLIMEKLGGGGHRTIAGAQIKDITEKEAIEKLKAVIDDMEEKGEI
ncbi:MAG TPA: DHH family phosphoesterase [Lachnoclostridium sp.]|nr:DHH family phosphoesterase [Lachnoclostridium sp.]